MIKRKETSEASLRRLFIKKAHKEILPMIENQEAKMNNEKTLNNIFSLKNYCFFRKNNEVKCQSKNGKIINKKNDKH